MDRRTIIKKKLKQFKNSVSEEIPITKMYFFGSRAKGTPNKYSDIDLIIISPKFKNMNFFKRGALMYKHWDLNYPVDFLCYTTTTFNKLKKQESIVKQAVKEGILI